MTRKPRSHCMLEFWYIERGLFATLYNQLFKFLISMQSMADKLAFSIKQNCQKMFSSKCLL